MADIYTEGLQNINKLRGKGISLEVINELRELYNNFKESKNKIPLNDDIELKAKRNGFEFLMNEIRYTFFYLIRENNLVASNGAIRRMESILDDKKIIINDLVTVNNHAFVLGENATNFSGEKNNYLFDEYLMEINDYLFVKHDFEKNYLDDKLLGMLNILLEKINNELEKLDLSYDDERPKLVLIDNVIHYNKNNLHIYISNTLTEICDYYYGNGEMEAEMLVENNFNEYHTFEIKVRKGEIEVKEFDANVWKLSNIKEDVKTLSKNLERNAIKKI